jgi:putative glycoside hydrolase with GxGYxYP motif/GxGYxY motif-containing protein
MRAETRRWRRPRYLGLAMAAVGMLCLIAVSGIPNASAASRAPAAPSAAASTALWPRFSTPRTVLAADATGLSGEDLLTATTLEGVYNATQRPSRLYLIRQAEDQFWLSQLPKSVRVVTIQPPTQGTLLQALLQRLRSVIKGAIVTDPSNLDTVNLATTMAGLDHAIVIAPDQESLVAGLGIPVLYSFDTAAFTADTPVQTYGWGVQNLLPLTSSRLSVVLSGSNDGNIRDYAVATKAFVFWLTSTNSAEEPVFNTIIEHAPVNTPILGYVPNETPDVADLSVLGHFLNGSDTVTNESVWASMPSPPFLREATRPAPIAAKPGTVYVAFQISDGDNGGYVQQRMPQIWQGPDLGAVPAGWTIAPGMVDYAPTMLEYFNSHLPRNSELEAGPSGIGYASEMSGADMTGFGELTREIMARTGLETVDTYEPPDDLSQYSDGRYPVGVSRNAPLLYQQVGKTVVFGQTSGYLNSLEPLFCTIHQQSTTEQAGGQPLFLEPLVNGYVYNGTDLLHIAQQLALAGKTAGVNFVFTTPTELELTMQRYYAGLQVGLPTANVQSMTGDQVLAEPLVSPSLPTGTVQVTGPNLVTNPSGAVGTTGWTASGGTVAATTYQGQPALQWTSDITTSQSWVHYYPDVTDGQTYTFSADVAGSGQVFMDVYNGSDETTLPVRLTSTYQKLTWTVTIPANAPTGQTGSAPQLQIRESGAGPVSVDISDTSVTASTPAC